MNQLSFHEKSLWVMGLGLIAAFGFYFNAVLPTRSLDVMPYQVVLFSLAVGLLVLVQIAGHALIALVDRRSDPLDERDRLIALKGTRNGAWVLATGVFFALCVAPATHGNFVLAHALLGAWVLAQLAEIGSQLVLYRRDA
jgi:hypothetical protein